MQITLTNITLDQLDELKTLLQDKPQLESLYWQLMGYWITSSGDESKGDTGAVNN